MRDKGNRVERMNRESAKRGMGAESWLLQEKLGGLRGVARRQAAKATIRLCPDQGILSQKWLGLSSLSPASCLLNLWAVRPALILLRAILKKFFILSLSGLSASPQLLASPMPQAPAMRARSSHSSLPQPSQLSHTEPYSQPDPPFLQSELSPPPGRAHVLPAQAMATVGSRLP